MNLIKDKNELALEFPKLTVYRPKFYSLKYNDNVTYECGCNNSHRLNDDTFLVFSIARPGVNFLFLCPKGFYSNPIQGLNNLIFNNNNNNLSNKTKLND